MVVIFQTSKPLVFPATRLFLGLGPRNAKLTVKLGLFERGRKVEKTIKVRKGNIECQSLGISAQYSLPFLVGRWVFIEDSTEGLFGNLTGISQPTGIGENKLFRGAFGGPMQKTDSMVLCHIQMTWPCQLSFFQIKLKILNAQMNNQLTEFNLYILNRLSGSSRLKLNGYMFRFFNSLTKYVQFKSLCQKILNLFKFLINHESDPT